MFSNYFKTALRSLLRNRSYTFINIFGLAAGISVCLLIFLVIRFHSSYENFHSKKDRIYRVLTEYHHSDAPDIFYGKGVPHALPAGIKSNFKELEQVATVYSEGNDQVSVLNSEGQTVKKFKEEKGVFLTEPSFFSIFDYPFLAGDPATAIKEPNTAVLTRDAADKYFGDWKSAIGKTIKWNNKNVLKITGILENIPANTDLQLKVVIAYGTGYTAEFAKSTDWGGTSSSFGCFVLFPQNLDEATFNTRLRAYCKKMEPADDKDSHIVEPLMKIHFDTHTGNFSGKSISAELIRALWMIAGFILLIACTNFINLSTAQAVNRAKEVGVRKVLGGNKSQLRLQFLTETFILVFCAVVFATIIGWVTTPALGKILDLHLSFQLFADFTIPLFLGILLISVTLLAGFYPSLVLSRFNPVNALKSKREAKSTKGISLRRGLVVFQFIIAQALIVGTIIMVKQMNYFTSRPLGFDKDAIVNIPFPGDSIGISKLTYLRQRLNGVKNIAGISFSSNTPVEDDNDNWTTFTFNHAAKETDFYAINKFTDDQYLPVYKLQLLAGRNLEPSDTAHEFLVNELLVKNLGLKSPEDILNKEISMWNGYLKGTVVGVLKEFNSRSFRRDLAPVLMTTFKKGYSVAGIKLTTAQIPETIASVEKIWNDVFPEFVFEYQFLDDKIAGFYQQEKELSSLYQLFAVVAIFLSCLGLYGLASFMAVQRLKEVGVRKVLGATAASIVYLFSKEFIALICIAFVIASPLAWFFMHRWLQDYPYRVTISWWIFLLGGSLSVIIALLTVSFQAIRAALTNPVKSLRSE